MKGNIYVELLREIYSVKNNKQLSEALKTSSSKIGNWEKGEISKTILKNSINAILENERNRFHGGDFIEYAKKKYKKANDAELAEMFGITQQALPNWRKSGLTIRSIFELIEKVKTAHAVSVVSPIIEYYPVSPHNNEADENHEIVNKKDGNQKALMKELNGHHGVYAFHDSQGVCVYVGKAKAQSLWREMNLAYNRKRGDAQAIMRIGHIKINRFDPKIERKRQIKPQNVPLFEIAHYFSAYHVEDAFIDNFEAAIIRMFSNTLLNSRMEKFEHI